MIFDERSRLAERALLLEDAVEKACSKKRAAVISSFEGAAVISHNALSKQSYQELNLDVNMLEKVHLRVAEYAFQAYTEE